jgi:hypothetical protein
MKLSFLLALLFVTAVQSTFADNQTASLHPGHFLLVTNGSKFYIPTLAVIITKKDSGNLVITSEDKPKFSAEITKEGGSYVFTATIPGNQVVPPSGQDWPNKFFITYAGVTSSAQRISLEGSCSTTFTYHNDSSSAQSATGTFTLYSIDKTEQDAAANP